MVSVADIENRYYVRASKARKTPSHARRKSKSAEYHARACEQRIEELRNHLRADIEKVHEPRMQAMFEAAAEILSGLAKAFRDYREKQETAFKKS
jgi:hypothetical protein